MPTVAEAAADRAFMTSVPQVAQNTAPAGTGVPHVGHWGCCIGLWRRRAKKAL
jgi:hypothetical protein